MIFGSSSFGMISLTAAETATPVISCCACQQRDEGYCDAMSLSRGLGNATLLQAEQFGSEWLDALRSAGTTETPVDLLMIGDFGKDQDDEKALSMAIAMKRAGLIGTLSVIANLGDSTMRARLAKGTLNVLGAHDVRVAVGSDGGRPGEEIHEYEFAAAPYLAKQGLSEADLEDPTVTGRNAVMS